MANLTRVRRKVQLRKKKKRIKSVINDGAVAKVNYEHRLHYRWSQLEADKSNVNIGSPARPRSKADRTMRLRSTYKPYTLGQGLRRQARFNLCASTYQTIDYNTFSKNGVIKLTEIELYFLSLHMSKISCHEWAVVYLGIGSGERFRWLRDEFFPELTVIAFDPLDAFFNGVRGDVEKNAEMWSNDGTSFTFLVRCFDPDTDIEWMKKKYDGKRLLLISDIRGIFLLNNGGGFDKKADQDVQWTAIQRLRPEKSIVKFTTPETTAKFYNYVPGVLLKQIFTFFGTAEMRLLIDGVPEHSKEYNVWEINDRVVAHADHVRGQVYKSTRRSDCFGCGACLCYCFDCTVLWDTVSMYARKSLVDPYEVLKLIVKNHVYDSSPSVGVFGVSGGNAWSDIEFYLKQGRLTEAVGALEAASKDDRGDKWPAIMANLAAEQPDLAQRLKVELQNSPSCDNIIRLLGSLSKPFTCVRTELNGLLEYPDWTWTKHRGLATDQPWPVVPDTSLWSSYKTKPCWFLSQGSCSKGANCTYKHTDDEEDWLCWYFTRGSCAAGSSCEYKHFRPQDDYSGWWDYKSDPLQENR